MSHDHLSTPMFPSDGEVLKDGRVSAIVQALSNAQVSMLLWCNKVRLIGNDS